jgi:hypothetical protein
MRDAEQLWLFDLDALDAGEEDDDEWTDEDDEAFVQVWQSMQELLRRFNDRCDADQDPPSGVQRVTGASTS